MGLSSRSEFWLIIIILVCCIASILLFYLLTKWWRKVTIRRRFRHGIKAEAYVDRILRSHGYQVHGVQQPITMTAYIDDEKVDYKVRPDAVASKDGREYLVEMKTGKVSINPMYSNTRRQLLEYYYSAPGDGVLLVNGDSGTVKKVSFKESVEQEIEHKSSYYKTIISFFLGALISALVFWLC